MRFDSSEREIATGDGKVRNLFTRWATSPVAGDWAAIRYLVHNIICDGSDETRDYMLNYLAHIVQKPYELPGVTIILQSEEQGTGKAASCASCPI